MTQQFTDPTYLAYQYADSEKLRIRQETHALYSEAKEDFVDWVLNVLEAQPGEVIADVGCGPGSYHAKLAAHGVQIVALDASLGMVTDVAEGATSAQRPVRAIQANAEQLPLADDSCDRLMANHMLYHVPDQVTALREMWRVLKPGGRVVLATNAADNGAWLRELHVEAATEHGYRPLRESTVARFSLSSGDLVTAVFSNARIMVREDAFLFPSVEAVMRYYASMMVDLIEDAPADTGHRPLLLASMQRRLESIFARQSVLRVPKAAGCFVAEKNAQ
ncbi:MAG: class I SAM-dependent methyltransferase [Caldilineaceae bacterium]|nr:class I SAM-dependent methyltransferase [Caldilineaceae bacterium]